MGPIDYLNATILRLAPRHLVADLAPSTVADLRLGSLVVWSGQSDNTVFSDSRVNYAFRALHDQAHLDTGLLFLPDHEIELGRRQAARYDGLLADLVYIEVSLQALYFAKNKTFVNDQRQFTLDALRALGYGL